ncbi:putative gtp binding protein and negative regulator of the ran tc4 gtpase cycle gtr1p protein [Neofusicoccum parvum UCRNP2]|uniref:Putative gtp binding protein and negative regulator of the ran tc4 gtpase cycle gtr1p protein n=1 Tax=Botryosphaeria parva (strain UCR-NP2) TaxID=1287680 RepID=R1GB02_BOTPV|nr:putative gtp binding protein and negative regulator of the ran tc4 gtpase cycle gtr1p protein [Neofusicoccum parvum UCRNP2]
MAAPKDSGYIRSNDPTRPRSDAAVPFREIIPPPDHPKIAGIEHCDAHSWCASRRKIDAPAWLIDRLDAKNLEKPFVGFTTDGTVRERLYAYADDEGAPVEAASKAAAALLALLSAEERARTLLPSVEDDAIRLWSNPELYVNPGGLRLDESSAAVRDAVHAVLRASLSPEGYEKTWACCLTNAFLGQLVNGHKVLNEHSYNFRLFGEPSVDKPWGYTFFGHHLCLAVVFAGPRMVIGPSFMGAEPDRIDEGPHKGLRLFKTEELESLKLMQSLSPELQEKATLSVGMDGNSLPADRWNPFDERHLGGARQDNRVVPFEGCPVKEFPAAQQEQIVTLYKAFNEYYPASVLQHRVKAFKAHLDETYFSWIGPHGDDDPYYFRIHSPVAFMELDFHCGNRYIAFASSLHAVCCSPHPGTPFEILFPGQEGWIGIMLRNGDLKKGIRRV